MFSDFSQKCDLCRAMIPQGTKYGVLVFNIECMTQPARVTVEKSETVHTMCMNCAGKYNNQTIKKLLD